MADIFQSTTHLTRLNPTTLSIDTGDLLFQSTMGMPDPSQKNFMIKL